MMTKIRVKRFVFFMCAAVVIAAGASFAAFHKKDTHAGTLREVRPATGDIQKGIMTTGTVEPQNRLEIKPPVSGRIEEIRAREGQAVKAGEVLALMSSTERAALLDAARLKGAEEVAYWQDVYKATPLIAPIDGQIIVRSVEPGQTVTTGDVVLVLSDRLIVKADVDETDIGEVKVGQQAVIGLDAYPDVHVGANVDHISYESELVNNVTIYSVDILPEEVPDVFRSGMSADVEIVVQKKQDVILLPVGAVSSRDGRPFVLIKDPVSGEAKPRFVQTGLEDEDHIEIVSGVNASDVVVIQKEMLPSGKASVGSNPFMPRRPGRK